jgi:ribonuclease Z
VDLRNLEIAPVLLQTSWVMEHSGVRPISTAFIIFASLDISTTLLTLVVDAGEGTLRQFSFQPQGNWSLRLSNVKKLFVTHMHADHVMGIVTILRNILLPPLDGINLDPALPESRASARIELYGPAGLRSFVRTILNMTHTRTADRYVVHELLTAEDTPTPCEPSEVRHTSENSGLDIYCSQDGCWRDFTSAQGRIDDPDP